MHEDIIFRIDNKDVLKFAKNGNIFIKGRLAQNDTDVVGALRKWLAPIVGRLGRKA